jgi:hypothetical protein
VPASLCAAAGNFTGTPLTTVGSTNMKMMRSTRQISTSGVTFTARNATGRWSR